MTLEPDVARRLKTRMAEKKASMKQVVNEALRAGLASLDRKREVKFSVDPHPCRFKPGIDPDKLNQPVDELEAEDALEGLKQRLPAHR